MMRSGRGGVRQGAGRKSPWQSGETQTIRVPVGIKEELVAVGQQLDRGQGVIGGRLRREMAQLLQHWESQAAENDSPEWQPVRQLLAEIQEVLDSHTCGDRPHGGQGHHQRQFRHQHQGRCGKLGRGVPVMDNETPWVEATDQTVDV
jgi:hypothetical protein